MATGGLLRRPDEPLSSESVNHSTSTSTSTLSDSGEPRSAPAGQVSSRTRVANAAQLSLAQTKYGNGPTAHCKLHKQCGWISGIEFGFNETDAANAQKYATAVADLIGPPIMPIASCAVCLYLFHRLGGPTNNLTNLIYRLDGASCQSLLALRITMPVRGVYCEPTGLSDNSLAHVEAEASSLDRLIRAT